MAKFEIKVNGRVKERFESDTDPKDAVACVALLKSRGWPGAVLVAKTKKGDKTYVAR